MSTHSSPGCVALISIFLNTLPCWPHQHASASVIRDGRGPSGKLETLGQKALLMSNERAGFLGELQPYWPQGCVRMPLASAAYKPTLSPTTKEATQGETHAKRERPALLHSIRCCNAAPPGLSQKRFVFFMIRKNSSSFTSPSPSRSASSIISWSSSSVMRSPNSLATRFKFLKEILPVSSSSNKRNAFKISSFGSRFKIL
mmetsp:Transcript_142985/g.362909  ORF Transcript_142985/g.362909 Transcript_142985/m.362909 type:complete len:201 (-) Transcript_142985:340-942(-)